VNGGQSREHADLARIVANGESDGISVALWVFQLQSCRKGMQASLRGSG